MHPERLGEDQSEAWKSSEQKVMCVKVTVFMYLFIYKIQNCGFEGVVFWKISVF
jgi:hypothetical protein